MKNKYLVLISTLVGAMLLFYLIYYIGLDELGKLFSNMNWVYLPLYLATSILLFLGFVWRWKLIIDTYGFKVKFFNLFFYKTSAFAINFITPSARLAGEPLRVHFLSKEGLETTKAASTVIMDKTVEMAADILLTMVGIMIFVFHLAIKQTTAWVVIVDLFLFLMVIVWFFYRLRAGKGVFSTLCIKTGLVRSKYISERLVKIKQAESHMHTFMTQQSGTFWSISLISIALWLLTIFEFKYLALLFGYDLNYTVLFAVLVGVGFAILIPIPASLGALEFSQVLLLSLLGIAAPIGIALGFITRLRDMAWSLVGVIYMYVKGVKIKDEIKVKKDRLV